MFVPIPPDNLPPAEDAPERETPVRDLPAAGKEFPMERWRAVPPSDDPDPYGAFLRFNKLFSRLRVQWSKPTPHNVTSTLRNRAEMVTWDPRALKGVEQVTGLLTSVPRRCPGRVKTSKLKSSDDPASQSCPCAQLYGNDPDVWKGHLCPGEAVRAYQHFVRYVRELDIEPSDHVDIGMVLDIIQLHLVEDRCNESIQIEGLYEDKAAVVTQKDSKVYYDRIPHNALAMKAAAQKQRLVLYKALMADRDRREKMRAQRVKERQDETKTDSFSNMAELFSAAAMSAPHEAHRLPVIDADFGEDEDEFEIPADVDSPEESEL